MVKKLSLAVCSLVLAVCAQAQESPWALGLHLGSVHDLDSFENNNVGAYVRFHNWSAGAFQNSVRKQSVYAAYTYELPTPGLPVLDSVALSFGLTTGYPKKIEGTELSFLFVPTMGFKLTSEYWLRVAVIPAFLEFNRSTAVHFMVEKKF